MKINFNVNPFLAGVIILVFLGGVSAIVTFQTHRPFKVFVISLALDNKEHFFDCEELPFYAQVETTWNTHMDVVKKIKTLDRIIDFRTESRDCQVVENGISYKKGDVVLEYYSHDARRAAEKILGKDFFGIPYRGYNH